MVRLRGLRRRKLRKASCVCSTANPLRAGRAQWQATLSKNGSMVCRSEGNLFTAREYENFVLRFEFKLPQGGNNGVSIRSPLKSEMLTAYSGIEIQIIDNDDPKYKDLQPYQFHGSVYGVAPAKREGLKPVGQWNSQQIMADGSHIKVTLNGKVINDVDLSKIDKTIDGQAHPGFTQCERLHRLGWPRRCGGFPQCADQRAALKSRQTSQAR